MTLKKTDKKVKFTAKGIVLGNYWGGGSGGYATIKFEADTKKELLKKANEALNNESIDSGMGYESLIGAILDVVKTTTIIVEDEAFSNKKTETLFIGKLTEKQKDFLFGCLVR